MGKTKKSKNKNKILRKKQQQQKQQEQEEDPIINNTTDEDSNRIHNISLTKHDKAIAQGDVMNTLLDDEQNTQKAIIDTKEEDTVSHFKPEPNTLVQIFSQYKRHTKYIRSNWTFTIFLSPFNWMLCRRFSVFKIWVICVYIATIVAIALTLSSWAEGSPSEILDSIFGWRMPGYDKKKDVFGKARYLFFSIAAFVFIFTAVTLFMSFLINIMLSIFKIILYIIRTIFYCCAGCCLNVLGYQPIRERRNRRVRRNDNDSDTDEESDD